jgi:hypothetical protein
MLRDVDGRSLQEKLEDPLLFAAFHALERGKDASGFFDLWKYAREGRLKGRETFSEICQVVTDQVRRSCSNNENLKYGVRYPANYLNFMVLMRSYGGDSRKQYAILTSQLGGPSPRHLRFILSRLYCFGNHHVN